MCNNSKVSHSPLTKEKMQDALRKTKMPSAMICYTTERNWIQEHRYLWGSEDDSDPYHQDVLKKIRNTWIQCLVLQHDTEIGRLCRQAAIYKQVWSPSSYEMLLRCISVPCQAQILNGIDPKALSTQLRTFDISVMSLRKTTILSTRLQYI